MNIVSEKKKCFGETELHPVLILSCYESNSLKVGQTCSLTLNKENIVLHMQPANMLQCFLLCRIRTGPRQRLCSGLHVTPGDKWRG